MTLTVASHGPLAHLEPLRARYGGSCSLDEFQRAVNLVFHEYESEVYDEIHQDMWTSLPQQFDLLASDIRDTLPHGPLRVLDIGSGTGLSSDLLLRSAIGPQVESLHLLDTSPRMLARAKARLENRTATLDSTQGLLDERFAGESFDVILTCSVLHHIPDLASFLAHVARIQKPGGFFIHLQDPNADAASDPELAERTRLLVNATRSLVPKTLRRLAPRRVLAAVIRRIRHDAHSYIDRTNRALLAQGYIVRPMTPKDMWAITDIHENCGDGISVKRLRPLLPNYELISSRTYAFFSQLISSLPPHLQREEAKLIEQRAQNGHYVSAAWQRMR
jgi:SAM-dependent methyltransferase